LPIDEHGRERLEGLNHWTTKSCSIANKNKIEFSQQQIARLGMIPDAPAFLPLLAMLNVLWQSISRA
jgi:hypothetical protein